MPPTKPVCPSTIINLRWSTYDAKALGIDVPKGTPTSIQERAYSSPIWYTPDPSVARAKREYYPGLELIIE